MTDSVSVVIPARNAQAYLEEAILSVLGQAAAASEVIVVDDGSTDATGAIARGFGSRVRYVRQDPAGAGQARNHGIESARSDLVAFLDADDLWTPDSLGCRLAVLAAEPECEAAFGAVEEFICDRLSAQERARLRGSRSRVPGWLAGSMVARRALFDRVGMFPTELRGGEFIAWFLRARRSRVRSVMLDDLVLRRRVHMGNLGRTDPRARSDLLGILRADLASRSA